MVPFLKGKMSMSRADDPPEGTAGRLADDPGAPLLPTSVLETSDDGKRTIGVEDGGEEVLV